MGTRSAGPSEARRERRPDPVSRLGGLLLGTAESLGQDTVLFFRSLLWCRSIFSKAREITRQMYIFGVMSFPVVALVGLEVVARLIDPKVEMHRPHEQP